MQQSETKRNTATGEPTIVIASGGTGGHLYPTIGVADALKQMLPGVRIVFIGTSDRIEAREVPRAGHPFEPIRMEAPKKKIASLVRFPFLLLSAILRSQALLRKYQPAAVLCGGAYLSVPVGIAARMLSIPLGLLEINSIGGKANKLLAQWAEKLFLAYPESRSEFAKVPDSKIVISGTPIRGSVGDEKIDPKEARKHFGLEAERKTLLIFGGSLGARSINEAVAEIVPMLLDGGYNLLWQIGKGNAAEEYKAKFQSSARVKIEEYIYEMDYAYAAADLVASRAGASSLAELSAIGKPAILIPYPFAAENHQEANARAFSNSGAAVVIRDSELKDKLPGTVMELMQNDPRREAMSGAMKLRANKDAAKIVAEWLRAQCK